MQKAVVHVTHHHPHNRGVKPRNYLNLNYFAPHSWVFVPPASTVFDGNDCIWYHGTLYVRESVAVAKLQQQQQQQEHEKQQQEHEKQQQQQQQQQQQEQQQQQQQQQEQQQQHETQQQPMIDDDDDTESISSGNGISAFKHPRNIGKQNQLKYLKDGVLLRHLLLVNRATHEWSATFDAETNRIIRTEDGVAFDTLRQFARLHYNEILATNATLTNVWSDPHFQYKDEVDGQWHPLSKLKQ